MPWTLLFSFLTGLPGALGEYFKAKNALALQQLQTQQAIALAQQQAAAEIAKGQMELNQEIVKSTGSYFKYFTFFMWFGPFMIGVVNPARADLIFKNLSGMPEWYVQSCMLIMFTVWGISVGGPVVANIFSGLTQYLGDRRADKIQMIKAKVDRTAYFNALRQAHGGQLSQQEVDINNKVLDKLDAS